MIINVGLIIRFAMNSVRCETTAVYITFGRGLRTIDDVICDLHFIIASGQFVLQITPYSEKLAKTWQEAKVKIVRNFILTNDNKMLQNWHRKKVLVTTHI